MSNTHTIIHDGVEHTLPRVTEIVKAFDWLPMSWPANEAVDFIIKHYDKQMDDDALAQLYDQARTAYKRKSDEAKELGSLVHEAIRQHLEGQAPILSDETAPHFQAFLDWMKEYSVVRVSTEQKVYSFRHGGYAGTADLLCYMQAPGWRKQRACVVDFKVSPRIYKSARPQIAMYLYAIQDSALLPVSIQHGAVLRFRKDKPGRTQFKLYSKGELQKDFYTCLHLVRAWWSKKK